MGRSQRDASWMECAGSEPRKAWRVDGANLLPVWMGQAHTPERILFWEWRSEGRHQLGTVVKAATLHRVSVTESAGRHEVRVIVDV